MIDFLPINQKEAAGIGWDELDIILVTGDAYVDHPSFGMALLGRDLVAAGYRVGIIPQPDWRSKQDFQVLGRPRLFFGVTAGALDSLVSHFSPEKKRRKRDAYSPEGKAGSRPDRATIVYVNRLREIFGPVPIVIGGIEASLRRLAHYDYWANKVRRSLLVDSRADVLVYGMGEKATKEIARYLALGIQIEDLPEINGTVVRRRCIPDIIEPTGFYLPTYEEVAEDKRAYLKAFTLIMENNDPFRGRPLFQKHGEQWVVHFPPAAPLTTEEMDALYNRAFTRRWHPVYDRQGGIPALSEVLFSVTTHRGCLGDCSFCSLNFHQGRIIQRRSKESIINEIKEITRDSRFRGVIHDIGGPSANFYLPACEKALERGTCKGKSCLIPKPCRQLSREEHSAAELLREVREIPGIKHVFVRSGVRFDYALFEKDHAYLKELIPYHVGGHLKVAPEHVADEVLTLMNKPGSQVYKEFAAVFSKLSAEAGKEQYLIPYLISGHPGCTLESAISLAEYIRDEGRFFEQVQDFTPTPMTVSTCMWFTGKDPRTGQEVYVPKGREKRLQRALLQFQKKKNQPLVREALRLAKREDLIGSGVKALAPPEKNR